MRSRPLALVLMALALLLACIAYWPSLDAGFYFDDPLNIHEAPALHWEELPWGNWTAALVAPRHSERFVPNITFGLNHLWGGLEPRGYHVVNLVIHLLMGISVAWLGYLMATERWLMMGGGKVPEAEANRMAPLGAALGAAVFLLHPLNIQAVTYVVQRMASLAALFGVLSFCLYVGGRRSTRPARSWAFLALAALAWLLAVGSKQNVLMVPVVMLAYEVCFHGAVWRDRVRELLADRRGRWWLAAAVGLALAGVILVDRLYLGGLRLNWLETYPSRDFSGWERVLTQARVHWFYLGLLLWPSPSRLNLDHDFQVSRSLVEPGTLAAILAWAVVLVGVVWLCRRRPQYGFPILAYMLLHGAESGPVNLELVFEHRMYLPMAFLAALAPAALVESPRTWRPALVAVFLLLLLPLSAATYQRNLVWADALAFHTQNAANSPDKPRPHNNLASLLHEEGRYEEALIEFETALEIRPLYLEAQVGRGKALMELGRFQEAENQFRTAIREFPHVVMPHLELGNLLVKQGKLPEAAEAFRSAVQRNRDDRGARYNLGGALLQLGQTRAAIEQLVIAQRLMPSWAATYRPLGDAYRLAGKREEALVQYQHALTREGKSADLHFWMGTLSGELGRWEEARHHLELSIALDNRQSQAHNNLANVLLQTGSIEQAMALYERSVELDPSNLQARINLASTYTRLGLEDKAAEQHQQISVLRSGRQSGSAEKDTQGEPEDEEMSGE